MNPGATTNCEASKISAAAGIRIASAAPASAMELPSMITRPGEKRSEGVNSVPASIAMTLLTAASKVRQDAAKVTAGFRKALLGFLPGATRCAHDYRHL